MKLAKNFSNTLYSTAKHDSTTVTNNTSHDITLFLFDPTENFNKIIHFKQVTVTGLFISFWFVVANFLRLCK